MPSTVEASRRQVSGGSSDEGEVPETGNVQVSAQDRDDYCSDSSSGSSDGSAFTSEASSATATPEHSTSVHTNDQIVADEFENNLEINLIENSAFPKWFKFKRKTNLKIYSFSKHLHVYLIMCLKFVLSTLLILATVQFSFPETSHRVVPQRFFPAYSLVKDYYSGDLQQLAEKLHYSDLAFVMYYAPWDRDSQQARAQFVAAARQLQDQVLFAAINCWQPDSSCRLNHKVGSFPALVLHVNTGVSKGSGAVLRENRALSYNGPLQADHMARFVSAALRPYRHVGDRKQLAQLQLTHSVTFSATRWRCYHRPVNPVAVGKPTKQVHRPASTILPLHLVETTPSVERHSTHSSQQVSRLVLVPWVKLLCYPIPIPNINLI